MKPMNENDLVNVTGGVEDRPVLATPTPNPLARYICPKCKQNQFLIVRGEDSKHYYLRCINPSCNGLDFTVNKE